MINLGLSRITLLLNRLPSPQTWTAVHIAGTNGKGSVAAYLSSLIRRLARSPNNSDIRIGKFTSPHLIDRWDCITINDKPVSQSLFLSVEQQVQQLSESVAELRASKQKVTEFELLTATAFEIFSRSKCQVAVIECGLGGRLDATNALDPNKVAVCVVTKIGLDHQGLLGNTIEEIAREKAGIAKPNVPFIYDGSNIQSVRETLEDEARKRGAINVQASSTAPHLTTTTATSQALPLHQVQNISLALQAYDLARTRIPTLHLTPIPVPTTNTTTPPSIIPQLLSDAATNYPGRLQHISISSLVPSQPSPILLDGAHNPQSATILREYIDTYLSTRSPSPSLSAARNITWILSLSLGKPPSEILSILLRPGDRVVTCPFGPVDGMPWVQNLDAASLAGVARDVVGMENVEVANDVVGALRVASSFAVQNNTSEPRLVVVAGSLYLVSDLLRALRDGEDVMRKRLNEQ